MRNGKTVLLFVISMFVIFAAVFTVCIKGAIKEANNTYTFGIVDSVNKSYDSFNDRFYKIVTYDIFVDGVKYPGSCEFSIDEVIKCGDTLIIYYDKDNPNFNGIDTFVTTDIQNAINVLYVGIFAFPIIIFLVFLLSGHKEPKKERNVLDINETLLNEMCEGSSSNHTVQEFLFIKNDDFKEPYIMKREDGKRISSLVRKETGIFKPSSFIYKNYMSCVSFNKNISNSVKMKLKIADKESWKYKTNINTYFNIDGMDNWKYLSLKGYGFIYENDSDGGIYHITKLGEEIGHIVYGKVKDTKPNATVLGNVISYRTLKVRCKDDDIDFMFLICMSIVKCITQNVSGNTF